MRVFNATLVNQLKSFYRDPQALIWNLAMPILILVILSLFNIHVKGPDGHSRPYIDLLLPGMIALAATSIGMQSVAFGVMRYKERGILRRIKASPARTLPFVCGIAASRVVMVALAAAITYLVGRYAFQAHMIGSSLGLIALAVGSAAPFIAIGMIAVGISKNEDQAGPLMFLFFFPMLLFSGMFVSRSGLNPVLAWITNGLPMTYLVDALQRVGFLGQGFSGSLWIDLAGLAVWGVVCTMIASRTWTWE